MRSQHIATHQRGLLQSRSCYALATLASTRPLMSLFAFICCGCLLWSDGVWDVMSDQEAIDFLRTKLSHFEARYADWKQQHSNGAEAVGYDTDGDGGKAGSTESKAADGDDDSPMDGADEQQQQQQRGTRNNVTDGHSGSHSVQSTISADGQPSASAIVDLIDCPRNLNEVLSLTAKALVKEALDRRSLDNVTVMIIAL